MAGSGKKKRAIMRAWSRLNARSVTTIGRASLDIRAGGPCELPKQYALDVADRDGEQRIPDVIHPITAWCARNGKDGGLHRVHHRDFCWPMRRLCPEEKRPVGRSLNDGQRGSDAKQDGWVS